MVIIYFLDHLQATNINGTDINQCIWQPYRTNTYMDGMIGVRGEQLYQSAQEHVRIQFIFAQKKLVILGMNNKRVLKVITLLVDIEIKMNILV
jgi:hypothetical protein